MFFFGVWVCSLCYILIYYIYIYCYVYICEVGLGVRVRECFSLVCGFARFVTFFFDGYCSTVQGLLDWFEVDLGFTQAFIYSNRFVCSVCFCSPLVLFCSLCYIHSFIFVKEREKRNEKEQQSCSGFSFFLYICRYIYTRITCISIYVII